MPHQQILSGVRVAILAADGFEQVELTRPRKHLVEHGADVEIVSLRPGSIRGMNLLTPGKKTKVHRTVFTRRQVPATARDGGRLPRSARMPLGLRSWPRSHNAASRLQCCPR